MRGGRGRGGFLFVYRWSLCIEWLVIEIEVNVSSGYW